MNMQAVFIMFITVPWSQIIHCRSVLYVKLLFLCKFAILYSHWFYLNLNYFYLFHIFISTKFIACGNFFSWINDKNISKTIFKNLHVHVCWVVFSLFVVPPRKLICFFVIFLILSPILKVKRLEGLLSRCKETIRGNKEKCVQLEEENAKLTSEIKELTKLKVCVVFLIKWAWTRYEHNLISNRNLMNPI